MGFKSITFDLSKSINKTPDAVRFFLSLLLLHSIIPASAAFRFTPVLEEAYFGILALKVDKGSQLLQEELRKDPHNGVAIYLENYADLMKLLILEDRELYGQLSGNENSRIDKISRLEKESPYYLFCQAEIKLQWAFIKLKFGEELSAAWSIRQAYKLLEQNQKKFPDFLPNKKSLGLLHVLIGSVPEKYTWVIGSVGMQGTVAEGLRELEEVQNSNLPFSLESSLLLSMIHGYILKSGKETLTGFKSICQKYPDNLLAHFVYASAAIKEGQSELALTVLQNSPIHDEYLPLHLIAYRKGEIFLQKGQYEQAEEHYNLFLRNYKGQNFLKDTYYKLFLIHWLTNQKSPEQYLDTVLETGQTVAEADKYAQKFAENRILPHKNLMKARLSFDGGYYQQATEAITNFTESSFSREKDKAEYTYRKARIFHKTGNVTEAMTHYLRTIQLSEEAQYYFGANAALQLGYIYQEVGKVAEARKYYEKALSYNKHEYKNSIDNKAKAALSELVTE